MGTRYRNKAKQNTQHRKVKDEQHKPNQTSGVKMIEKLVDKTNIVFNQWCAIIIPPFMHRHYHGLLDIFIIEIYSS